MQHIMRTILTKSRLLQHGELMVVLAAVLCFAVWRSLPKTTNTNLTAHDIYPPATIDFDRQEERSIENKNSPANGALVAPHGGRRTVAPAENSAPGIRFAEASARSPMADIALDGRIIVVDHDGSEHPCESGTMNIIKLQEGVDSSEVEIVNGKWTVTVPHGALLAVSNIVLGGRRAVLINDEPALIADSESLSIRAHWRQAAFLWVRSAETGQQLSGVELVSKPRIDSFYTHHPGIYSEASMLIDGATSPIDLGVIDEGVGDTSRILYVRAPGYAWKRIEIDSDMAIDRTLDLVVGGSVRVVLIGSGAPGARLRLRQMQKGAQALAIDMAVRKQQWFQIDSLLPGRYSVSVEVGDWFAAPNVLSHVYVDVSPGGVSHASLEVAPLPETASTWARGTIAMGSGWEGVAPNLSLESIGQPMSGPRKDITLRFEDLHPVANQINTWSFDAGLIPQGEYKIEVNPPYYIQSQRIDNRTGDLRISIPARAIVSLRVLDIDRREMPDITLLHWRPKWPKGVTEGHLEVASRSIDTHRFEIQAPAGRILVSVATLEFVGSKSYDIAAGLNEIDLIVAPAMGFDVVIQYETLLIPWSPEWEIAAYKIGGQGESRACSPTEHGMRVFVTSPGTYRFSLPHIAGFQPIPEQEVIVPEHDFSEHVVNLMRE